MEKIIVKTNINCDSCVRTVTPFLNEVDEIDSWQVDTSNPDKPLTITFEGKADIKLIHKTLESAGFHVKE